MEPLEKHLGSKAAEGQLVDVGSITLNTRKARERIARFALAEPGLWLVKVVQSAVACGAEEVRITFTRRMVRVIYDNVAGWSADHILQAILSGQAGQDRALHHLRVGMTAAMGLEGATLAWSCGQNRVVMLEDQIESEVLDRPSPQLCLEARRPGPYVSLKRRMKAPISHLFKQTAHEFMAVVRRCRVSPIPIWVDGHRLHSSYLLPHDSLPKQKNFNGEASQGLVLLLAVKSLHCWPDRPHLSYPVEEVVWNDEAPWTDDGEHLATQIWKPQPGPAQAVVCLYACLQFESEVVYTMDGAELEARPLLEQGSGVLFQGNKGEGLLLRLYMEVAPQEVDLSEFQVREIDTGPLLDRAVGDLLMMLRALQSRASRPWNFQRPERRSHPHELSAVTVLGMTGLLMAVPPILAAVGCVAVLSPFLYLVGRSELAKRRAQLEDLLQAKIGELEERASQGS